MKKIEIRQQINVEIVKINDNRTFQDSLFKLIGRSDTSSAYI